MLLLAPAAANAGAASALARRGQPIIVSMPAKVGFHVLDYGAAGGVGRGRRARDGVARARRGRRDAAGDECEIEESAATFAGADLDMESLVLATVASPAFRSAVGSP